MTKYLKHRSALLATLLCTSLAACETTSQTHSTSSSSNGDRSYCDERPAVCALIGVVVVGGVIALASSSGGGGGSAGGGNVSNASDSRVKTDVRFVEQLENGINLYAFRYTGDDRVFVGVNAEEIRDDPRYAYALLDMGNDILGVDYQALGLVMINEAEMRAASNEVILRAAPL
ncbi:hypothetical protein [Aliiroseovarius sediminis]|uniref:hypothetical protein n=1 Tax=Aliiroseovarius sediminis TaxID=2925839 RepID=UPI001F560D7B|nr:hypothetical protein [Aliiroseovarius sediminis]MCI2393117.1 hypothetical protein [Aliiroseovarius sediminis]